MGNDNIYGKEHFNPEEMEAMKAEIKRNQGLPEFKIMRRIRTEFNEDMIKLIDEDSGSVNSLMRNSIESVIKLKDDAVKDALKKLGYLDPGEVEKMKDQIEEMADAAASVLRITKMIRKNYISSMSMEKLWRRAAYLEELVEKERGDIAPKIEEKGVLLKKSDKS